MSVSPKWVCLLVLTGSFLHAQTIPIIHVTNAHWRYYQDGHEPTNAAQPGVLWMAPEFDDTAWPQGLGVFGFETNAPLPAPIQTPLLLTAPGATNQTIAYYFRTSFHWMGGSNVFLRVTNLIDDGAVLYLNGIELFRMRMSGSPTDSTLASGVPAVEGAYEVTNFFSNRLLPGTNHLAVEVHQVARDSSDVVFGLAISAGIPQGVVITEQPPKLIDAVAQQDIQLSVAATGSELRYFWHRNGDFLSATTNATLLLNNITTNQAGTYHVIVSNLVNAVRSSNTVLRVVPDTFGPRVLQVFVPAGDTDRILVSFDEIISTLIKNTNDFVVTEIATGTPVPVTLVQVGSGNGQVRLTSRPVSIEPKTIRFAFLTLRTSGQTTSHRTVVSQLDSKLRPISLAWQAHGRFIVAPVRHRQIGTHSLLHPILPCLGAMVAPCFIGRFRCICARLLERCSSVRRHTTSEKYSLSQATS